MPKNNYKLPEIIIFAGPNGSGKTFEFFVDFFYSP
jgi:predicted ABC-type ATPase